MPKKGTPKQPEWSPHDVLRVRQYAERGFSAREAGLLLVPVRTRAAVSLLASRLGIHFRSSQPGAPFGNKNRVRGELRKQTLRIAAGDC